MIRTIAILVAAALNLASVRHGAADGEGLAHRLRVARHGLGRVTMRYAHLSPTGLLAAVTALEYDT